MDPTELRARIRGAIADFNSKQKPDPDDRRNEHERFVDGWNGRRSPDKPKRKSRNKAHTALSSKVEERCIELGGFAWGHPTGTVKSVKGFWISYGRLGSPDVLCGYRGRFLGFETKTGTARLRDSQEKFKVRFEAAGCIYVVVRELGDVDRTFADIDARRGSA